MAEDNPRMRLGRGLAALLGDVGNEAAAETRNRAQRRVPIEFLRPNPLNPRQTFPEAELEDFRKGFEANGAQPDSVDVIADFPDEPPADVANPMLRTLAVGNWLRLVKSGVR